VNWKTNLKVIMERKEFIKRLGLGTMIMPMLMACGTDEVVPDSSTGTGSASGSCSSTPSETAGPFPTKNPASLLLVDIRSDRTGVPLTIQITIQNMNNSCEPLPDAIVDIWHCDRDGYYSEYGGSGMQSTDLTQVHFLRGRQTTDASGVAAFTSIFPGWYAGRAPHIHVHVYDTSGKSLLVTQIAFPTTVCDTVYTTATQFYTRGKQDTSNASDNVFSDSIANEMASLTGSVADGYALSHTIVVEA
jgi:protocatechuate 3,4-dioxygenase beta subunit